MTCLKAKIGRKRNTQILENIIEDLKSDLDQSTLNWELFVGPNSDYYISNWKKMKRGKWLSFNLAACFFVGFWMIYRKMYLLGLAMFLLPFGQSYLEGFLVETFNLYHTQMYWSIGLDVFVAIVIGLVANGLYMKKAERTIQKIEKNHLGSSNHEMKIQNAGGTSPLFLGMAVLVFVAYYSWKFYL